MEKSTKSVSWRSWILLHSLMPALLTVATGAEVRTTTTSTYRPTTESNVQNLNNPGNARDPNIYTAAGTSMSRICYRDCTTPIEATATWSGFPSSGTDIPLSLEIKWSARSDWYSTGSTSEVLAKIEYNLGGSWATAENYLWVSAHTAPCPSPSNQAIQCPDHVISVDLDPQQDITQIQVRATLVVQMTVCNTCTSLGFANVTGSISIYDVRVIAEDAAPNVMSGSLWPSTRSNPRGICNATSEASRESWLEEGPISSGDVFRNLAAVAVLPVRKTDTARQYPFDKYLMRSLRRQM